MMGASSDWQEVAYKDAFDREIWGLRRRLESDPLCTAGDLEGTLHSLYIMDGADWLGRGEVQGTVMAATIAAHETIIEELKKKL
jgi:hypothetical protein